MNFESSVLLNKLVSRENLAMAEAEAFMNRCMDGELSPALAGAILTALNMKGESIEEITACAGVMREKSIKVPVEAAVVVDCVGTGGDRSMTFNVSSAAALVVAAAGFTVGKHGNRSVTSACGSADLFEALGVDLELPAEEVAAIIEKTGFGFLFAPKYHVSMKNVAPIRRELGIRTIFNLLGPVTNPAGANVYLVGLFDGSYLEPVARSLANLGARSFYVVHAEDGTDEVTNTCKTRVFKMFLDRKIESFVFDPTEYGFERVEREALKGGDPARNASIVRELFEGNQRDTPMKDALILNAGFALSAAENLDLRAGFRLAREVLESGKAGKFLDDYLQNFR